MLESDDESLYNNFFELEIRTTTLQEPDWYNTTLIKINFLKPPCEVSQLDIDSVAVGIPILQLEATRGLEETIFSYYEIL